MRTSGGSLVALIEGLGALSGPVVGARAADPGQHAAVEIRTQNEAGPEGERRRLSDQRRALAELPDAMREVAVQRDHTLSSAPTGRPPTVRSMGTEEERL